MKNNFFRVFRLILLQGDLIVVGTKIGFAIDSTCINIGRLGRT